MSSRALLAMLAAAAVAACRPEIPDLVAPSFELVDVSTRLDAKVVNAHTYGTFVIDVAGGLVTIRSGPANFPGNPPGGPGTCVDGLWINSRGKPTAGSLEHPHPHCVATATGMTIVLEPISSRARDLNVKCETADVCDFLFFSDLKEGDIDVQYKSLKGLPGSTQGEGTVFAYAIDAATLGTTNARVGTISIDLNQYDDPEVNLFGICVLDDGKTSCLPRVVSATYKPLGDGGVGVVTTATGFLWWAPATAPYNY
ncbi:MAG: hypothetical protein ACKVZ0_20425 [Gemmatimonadales bacterium]